MSVQRIDRLLQAWLVCGVGVACLACLPVRAWADPPQRIVSLLPSLTESVCALGACARLVGVDRYSNEPAPVRQLPQLGGGLDPQLERIVRLKPDLVLVARGVRVIEPLERLGLRVLAFETQSLADVEAVLVRLQDVLQSGDAQALMAAMRADIAAAAQRVAHARTLRQGQAPWPAGASAARPRVYFEVSPGPYAAGPDSYMGQLLTQLGADNIVRAAMGPFPKINPEYVVRANPDLILIHQAQAQGLTQRVGWRSMRAIAQRHICAFSSSQTDLLERPGPRIGQAAQLLADCLIAHTVASDEPPGR
jgi:iron complex transport system substrate-binding protein